MNATYKADYKGGKQIIEYLGNKINKPIGDITTLKLTDKYLKNQSDRIIKDKKYFHLHNIDNTIFLSAVEYFKSIGADWCNLPITTLMISSPGEVYSGDTLDYTTDALPVEIDWFNNKRKAFLSESSQFYLELRLLIDNLDKVFSIYNSFRKEDADFSHLAEFQHIEFEGKIGFEENIELLLGLMRHITASLVKNNMKDLKYFLSGKEIKSILSSFDKNKVKRIPFTEAMDVLFNATGDKKYKKISMKYFKSWEEIKLTEILNSHVLVTHYPLMEIPFYHKTYEGDKNKNRKYAQNADLILFGYREVIGSGTRIKSIKKLEEKVAIFNLPKDDYEPYLKTRRYKKYKETSGFGMGWQRYVQWLLKLPVIWDATHIPRGQYLPKP